VVTNLTFANDESHYDVISRPGHLFRPLGWEAPQKKSRYKLIGTRISDDGTGWAYMSLDGNRYVINALRVGNDFDGSVVKEITIRKVVMENGVTYELPATEFLSRTDKGSKRSKGRGSTSVQGDTSPGKREQRVETRTPRRSRRGRENLRQRWETFQSATPEERERMIKEFRQGRRRR
tara:strand:- start:389 stop:922 length:534 start_codon:yes stop_codon:yes gene_type:complete